MSKEVNNEEGQYEEPVEGQGNDELNEGEDAEFEEPDEGQGENSEERGKKSG
jgi:hypothetical protein